MKSPAPTPGRPWSPLLGAWSSPAQPNPAHLLRAERATAKQRRQAVPRQHVVQRGVLGNVVEARLHVAGHADRFPVLLHVAKRADVEGKDDLGEGWGARRDDTGSEDARLRVCVCSLSVPNAQCCC